MSEPIEKLFVVLSEFAKSTIRKGEEPMAMAAGINRDGQISLIGIVLAGSNISNRVATGTAIKALREADKETHFVATGMLFPIGLTEGGKQRDALYVCLEDREGTAEDSIVTYEKSFFRGWKFAAPRIQQVEARVFGSKGDELVALVGELEKSDHLPD